jgi:hypothetical protein
LGRLRYVWLRVSSRVWPHRLDKSRIRVRLVSLFAIARSRSVPTPRQDSRLQPALTLYRARRFHNRGPIVRVGDA